MTKAHGYFIRIDIIKNLGQLMVELRQTKQTGSSAVIKGKLVRVIHKQGETPKGDRNFFVKQKVF